MEQLLQDLFVKVLNMSITGSYAILAVIIVRLLLRRAPKLFSYGLWSIVLFRLVCPVSFSSALSLFNFFGGWKNMEHIPADLDLMDKPQVDLGIASVSNAVNTSLPAATPTASANPMQIMLFIYSVIWFTGIVILLCCGILSYLRLKRQISTAVLTENHVYECENIGSPFVIGILKPKIYLPPGLSASERSYILKHEQTHIKRFDHLLKPLAFLVLCIHWFNPLVWIGFLLMTRDMEMSCDESVLRAMGATIKKDYSNSLLNFAAGRKLIGGSPLAFGEHAVRDRIQNILNYRRPPTWIAVTAMSLLLVMSVGLVSNPQAGAEFSEKEKSTMAAVWAEALKTRDGKPRYDMMSEEMKSKFIEGQKHRSIPWNFNIGVSSPWVKSYDISIKGNSAEILYHLTDSTGGDYEEKELIYFGKENGKTVVIKSEELPSEWERVDYYAPTAEQAMKVYTQALLDSDYSTILSLTHSSQFDPNGQQIWDTVKIKGVKIVNKDVRDHKACYELELNIADGGSSAFERGNFPRWLWLVKDSQGWYAEGLMTGGAPEQSWWEEEVSGNQKNRTYTFDKLIYLSLLSSRSFDYAEKQMSGIKCTVNNELFEIDYPAAYSMNSNYSVSQPVYQKEKMDLEMAKAFEESTMGKVSISDFKEKYRYTIYTKDKVKTNFHLYVLDDQVWLSSFADNTADGSEITMYLCKLK